MLAADDGHEVELVAGWTQGDRGDDIPAGRSRYRRVRSWLPTRDFTGLLSWSLLTQLWVSIGRSDVVHVSFAREAIPIAAVGIAALRRRPVVAQPHGMLTSRSSRMLRLLDRVIRPLMRRPFTWIALTEQEEHDLLDRFGTTLRSVRVVGNPVPFDEAEIDRLRASASPIDRTAIFIARLHPRKRVLDFAAAAAIAEENDWSDRYVAAGPDQGDLPELLERARAIATLRYDGQVPSAAIPALLARSGVFVLTSENEPWGNVLASAVALGVPSVITRSSALANVLEGEPGVRVVDDGDPVALAGAVHEMLETGHVDPSRIFGRDTVRRALVRIYRSAASERTRP